MILVDNFRDKSAYEGMTRDTVLTFEQAIECYRVITGIKHFVESRTEKPKANYTIAEIITITKNQYGNKIFSNFFKQ